MRRLAALLIALLVVMTSSPVLAAVPNPPPAPEAFHYEAAAKDQLRGRLGGGLDRGGSYQQDAQPDVLLSPASLLPEVDLYAATRADADTLAALDALIYRVTDALPDEISPPLTLSQIITNALFPDTNIDAAALLATFIGDTIAVGVDLLDALADGALTEDDAVIVYAVAPLNSRPLVESALLLSGLLSGAETSTQGEFTIYALPDEGLTVAISNELIYLVDGAMDIPLSPAPSLAASSDFNDTVAALDTDTATALFYGGSGRLIRDLATDPSVQEIFAAFGFEVTTLGPVAGAFTLDAGDDRSGDTLQVDLAQARAIAANPPPPLNPAFAEIVPGDSDIFVHSTDIDRLLNTLSGLIASISGSTTSGDIYAQFETLASLLLSLDLQADILPLLAGDYGVFGQIPAQTPAGDELYAGALLTISDTAGAQTLVDAVAAAIERLSENVTLSETRIIAAETGASVNALVIELVDDTLGPVEIAVAPLDDVLFVATLDAAVALLGGDERLPESAAYQEARSHYLPDTGLAAFLADRAPGAAVSLGFALLDPVGTLFERELAAVIVDAAPAYFAELVSSSGISAAEAPNGDVLVRLSITLEVE